MGRSPVAAENLIRIMCPNLSCQRVLAVPEAARGRVVRCRVCGMNVKIPATSPTPPAEQESEDAKTK